MKKIIVSLLLLVTFCFPVFSQGVGISLRTFKLNNGIDLLKNSFSPSASEMYGELESEFIGDINEYEIIKVGSFIDFLDWVKNENYISVVKRRYNNPSSETSVGINPIKSKGGTKKIAIIYWKNEKENFDEMVCFLVNY
jgi:hypothetical protein